MTHHRLRPTEVDEAARGQPGRLIPGREHRPGAGEQLRFDAHAIHPVPPVDQTQLEIPKNETRVRILDKCRRTPARIRIPPVDSDPLHGIRRTTGDPARDRGSGA
ncbi:hypothetical protein GCM10022236_35850 [Microlunatus ginsengisoli]|uniref:Uncharacterized protein n=1 Tax=Microlunatus ginsengisoli TaxID=363863 RepID=A0ABP7ADW5_9ACTN